MARYDRLTVFNTIISAGLIPLFYDADAGTAIKIAEACAAGGAPVLEFTNRGEKALPVFIALNEHIQKANLPVILGVGSIVDAPTAALFIANGANFVVGPVFNPEIANLCNRRKVGYIPGCATASEISNAEAAGAEVVKVHPASTLGGPAFVKAVLAPMPWSKLMASGGVEPTRENIEAWFKAGTACVGMGGNLIRKDWVTAGDFAAIQNTTSSVIGWIKTLRK
jgi:2-dehydro-3-deoxyphosphogluconate aldolase / (4S)-4-hydroxy-2-oxoglutarate aldolase